jgi:hypothetical protein
MHILIRAAPPPANVLAARRKQGKRSPKNWMLLLFQTDLDKPGTDAIAPECKIESGLASQLARALALKRQLIGTEMCKSLSASEVPSEGAYPKGDL